MPSFRILLAGAVCLLALVSAVSAADTTGDGDGKGLRITPELSLAQEPPGAGPAQPPPMVTPAPGAAAPADVPAAAAAPAEVPLVAATSGEVRDQLPPLPTIDLTTPPDDLWQRIRNGFGMPDLHSPLVANRQAYYLNRPEMVQRIAERSRRYLHHIVEELDRRGMPMELALLPMVESAFNPLAYSSARALGMWQFIPSTGKTYNLDQNWWRDERRDIIASTSAALDYLQYIYEMHGDWHLALASYNWGENAVARAIAKNQAKGLPTDYASLTMPGETRYYVPKLQALKNIIAQPEVFGFALEPIPNRPYFETVDMPGDMDVTVAAKLAEVPLDEFIALNPAYHRPLIRGDKQSQLVLPTEKVQTFLSNLQRYEAEDRPLATWRTYSLKAGEKLDAVAQRFGLTLMRLKQLNGITARVKIGPGFNLLVPGQGAQNSEALAAQLPKVPADMPRAGKRGNKRASVKPSSKRKIVATVRKPAAGKRRR